MNSSLIIALAGLVLALAPPVAQAAPPWPVAAFHEESLRDRIVAFGDSLSDAGNVFVATGDFARRPFDAFPDAPYLIGGFRFSNGPTWIEWLTRDLGLRQSGRPSLLWPGRFTNYAFGGARARQEGPVNLGTEIDWFLGDFGGAASSDALYVVWIGGNDLRDAAVAILVGDPVQAERILEEALAATAEGVRRLYSAGARSFLIANLPNLGLSPPVRLLGAEAQALARALSAQYNAGLEAILLELEGQPDIAITRLDVFAFLNDLTDNPGPAGLVNVTDSCIVPDVIVGAICANPEAYVFWDVIHPTTRVHRLLSELAQTTLGATLGAGD
jgi:outer membrane lipase/esterase